MPASPQNVWRAIQAAQKEVPHDPLGVRLREGRPRSTRPWRPLSTAGEDAKVLGGGQSLLPVLRLRLNAPTVLVDVSGVDEMRASSDEGGSLLIGAAVTTYEVLHDAGRQRLGAAARRRPRRLVADPAIRHRGTFGGSCTHADPAGDLPTVARALDAEFVIAGPGGRRTVAAADFFVDYFTTAVGPDEVLVAVRVPEARRAGAAHYEKFHRTAQAWAIVGVAAAVKVEGGTHHRRPRRAHEHGSDAPCGHRRSRPRSSAARPPSRPSRPPRRTRPTAPRPTSDIHAAGRLPHSTSRASSPAAPSRRPPACSTTTHRRRAPRSDRRGPFCCSSIYCPVHAGAPRQRASGSTRVLGGVDVELGGLGRQPHLGAAREVEVGDRGRRDVDDDASGRRPR